MSNCQIELAEWISDDRLLCLINQTNYRALKSGQKIDLHIDATEEQLQNILECVNGLSDLKPCVNLIYFMVEGVHRCGYRPGWISAFQMERSQYTCTDLQTYQATSIPERFTTPIALIDYSNKIILAVNQPFADLLNKTVEATKQENLFQYWDHGLERLIASLRKYGKARQPCCFCLGAQLIPTWIMVNALLLKHESNFIFLIELADVESALPIVFD